MSLAARRAAPSSRVWRCLPDEWTDFIPELNQQPGDIVVTKRTWGAFASTDLEALRSRGVTQVVIAGVATGTGVEATARQAYEQGFNVTLAIDAMTDTRPEAHDYSIANVFPRLGETGTTQAIIESPGKRSARHEVASSVFLFLWRRLSGQCRSAFRQRPDGRPFQSPFAKPRGQGLSSSTVNVLWGLFNIIIGYLLVCRVGISP